MPSVGDSLITQPENFPQITTWYTELGFNLIGAQALLAAASCRREPARWACCARARVQAAACGLLARERDCVRAPRGGEGSVLCTGVGCCACGRDGRAGREREACEREGAAAGVLQWCARVDGGVLMWWRWCASVVEKVLLVCCCRWCARVKENVLLVCLCEEEGDRDGSQREGGSDK
jgi:hypothetical protein